MKKYKVGIVGATGVVGREIAQILESRQFPIEELRPLASERSLGQSIIFNNTSIDVQVLSEDTLKGLDFALFSAGSSISKEYCPIAVKHNVICIDNTSYFRMDETVPLVVPEVNAHDLQHHTGIIANPNCSTAQLVVALKPIHDAATIKRIIISTYQSVSGAGKAAIQELEHQSRGNLAGHASDPKEFTHSIAFNAIPKIDSFLDNGYTKEEMKLVNETKKILNAPDISISATAVRIPVFISHSESVNIQTETKLTRDDVISLLEKAPGVSVMDDPENNEFPTPKDISGKDDVYVGRIREDISTPSGIELWCVGDNLRKGAALNAVQIAETLIVQ